MGIGDILKAGSIKKENEKLLGIIEEMGAGDAITVKNKIEELKNQENNLASLCTKLNGDIENLNSIIKEKESEIIVLDENILLESFALYTPKFNFLSSDEYKDRLTDIRDQQKQMIKAGDAVAANYNWTVNNSKAEGKKMVNDMVKLLLRSFNNECDYCVDNVKFNNIESHENRIEKSFETLEKLGRIMNARITKAYKALKIDELHLAHEYQLKKQEEKEEQKKAREELREQQKLEQEIRQAREKIAKEKKHFEKAINELENKFNDCKDESEKKKIEIKLKEIQQQFDELKEEEKVIDYREKNAKAGYVYIISNIGSFGEDVYKIGMTRRLDPMDRVDELGDASVPFTFDVHGMIFSDNAPALESKLHEHFHKTRINKLNNRKEFFRAQIHEIEKVVKDNYNNVVDIIKDAPAEQYRESLLINE